MRARHPPCILVAFLSPPRYLGGMSIFAWVVVAAAVIVVPLLVLAGVLFFHYAKALEEAHREGWDMPS